MSPSRASPSTRSDLSDTGPRYGERTAADVCYRHPNRQSFVLCQRCGRTICPECQTPAAVGVQCPECVREGRAEFRAQRAANGPRTPALVRRIQGASSQGAPVVTYAIMAICVLVWVLESLPVVGTYVTDLGVYQPLHTADRPWTLLTNIFLHQPGLSLHLPLNMLSLYFIGPPLESMLGRVRYLALFVLAGFGGSIAVLLLAPLGGVYGASGAIFGLMGAYFIIARRMGQNGAQILVFVGLNLALGFFIGGISWQAHIGGLVVGALVSLVLVLTRARRRRTIQIAALAGVAVLLVVITVVAYRTTFLGYFG